MQEEARRRATVSPSAKTVDAILNVKTESDTWSPRQETMFAVLRRTFKNDFCKIAEMMNVAIPGSIPKTCKEVHGLVYDFM